SAGTALRVLGDSVDVRLVDECGTRQRWLSAADDVAVAQIQPQRINRQVALQVRLLVDGPLHVTVLDRIDKGGVRVEGSDPGLADRKSTRLNSSHRTISYA